MIHFPLHIFLASLEADGMRLTIRDYERIGLALQTGGAWTLTRLRDTLLALLAKNEDQRDCLTRRFNEFFPPRECGEVDVARILGDLRRLAQERCEKTESAGKPGQPQPIRPPAPRPAKPTAPQRIPTSPIKIGIAIALYVVFFFIVGVRIWQFWPPRPEIAPTPTTTPAPISPTPSPERMRLYSHAPDIKQLPYTSIARSQKWLQYAALAVVCLAGGTGYGIHLRKSRKIPEDPIPDDQAPAWNPDKPRHFPLGSIGGKPAPRFEPEALNQLADSMGYFLSQQRGRVLNVPASIEATMRAGGAPKLTFFRRKQARSLLILEDALAEPLLWNSLAAELAEGMRQRGVPVLYGQFMSIPEQFMTEDGRLHRLEDLEDQRRGYLLLIFTDGKRFARPASRFALESLARWPMTAWMELRDPQFWDEYAAIPLRHGLPIYPATPQGVTRAVRRFLTELGAEPDFSQAARHWQEHAPLSAATLEANVEQTLGDALIWAQDCAMLQPLTPGLADALRCQFHPHLPYERLERLYALPGTSANVSGLRFAEDVLKVLRTGFLTRRDDAEQEEILEFLIEKIEEAEPQSEEDSLAHFAWETVKERVRLELEPDHALERLAQLAQTPVGDAIKAGLENFTLAGETQDAIPLRVKPRSRTALRRLAQLTENVKVPPLQTPPPLNWRQRLVFAMLVLACAGCCGWSVYSYVKNIPTTAGLEISGLAEAQAQLEMREADTWRVASTGDAAALQQTALRPGREYRLTVFGEGMYKTGGAFTAEAGQIARLEVERREEERPCQEAFPQRGLTIQRCPESEGAQIRQVQLAGWRETLGNQTPENRFLSVGLEISDLPNSAELRTLRNLLLQSDSVDIIYRIQPIGGDPEAENERQIDLATVLAVELDTWTAQSQLIWWQVVARPANVIQQEIFTEFGRSLKAGMNGKDLSWVASIQKLLNPGQEVLVIEEEIAQELGGNVQIEGKLPTIALIRFEREDIEPPSPITSLKVTELNDTLLELSWIASGDDGSVGTAATYDLRYAEVPLNEMTWVRATQADGEPTPLPAGTEQRFQVPKLWKDREIFWGMKVIDEALNISDLSEVAVWSPRDDIPPSRIVDLRVTQISGTAVTLTWTAPGNSLNVGKAARYDIRSSDSPITDETEWMAATPAPNPPEPSQAGTLQSYQLQDIPIGETVFLGIKAIDHSGNISPLSNVIETAMDDIISPAAVADLNLEQVGKDWAKISWTATGDDEQQGVASAYILRYSGNVRVIRSWNEAVDVQDLPVPSRMGTKETALISGLSENTTYYVGLRVLDDQGNSSEISNILRLKTLGYSTPATVTDLGIEELRAGGITLNWTAPQGFGEDRATVSGYDIRYAREPIREDTWETAEKFSRIPTPSAPDTLETATLTGGPRDSDYYVALKSYDALGNLSALSNVIHIPQIDTVPPAPILDLLAEDAGQDWVSFSWTATGDDQKQGQASAVLIGLAPSLQQLKNWDQAIDIPNTLQPGPAGMKDSFVVTGLKPDSTFFVAVKSVDEFGNVSEMSNIIRVITGDCWTRPVARRVCLEKVTGMEFVWIEGGTFWMGCGEQETECYDWEKPRHQVTVAGFWMGKTEVTNAQYRQFKPEHDSQSYEGRSFNGDTQPVVYVNWEDAQDFAAWLTKQNDGKYEFRLPTEAEWEYAARAGTTTARYWGDNPNEACQFANVADDTVKETFKELTKYWSFHDCDDTFAETSPVASFKPNAFGLYDMLGNVWEWVTDPWHDNYEGAPDDGSAWAGGGSDRVLRGGGWYYGPRGVRSAIRDDYAPSYGGYDIGFRLVRTN